MRRCAGLFAGLLLVSGCASTSLPPMTAAGYVPLPEERRLWQSAEEEQRVLERSGLLFADRELETYLNGVARRLLPAEARERLPLQVTVLDHPYANAFAYPNGRIFVHTGILALMENEAQLATLLAHEMTHATHRHAAREQRGLRNKTAFLASLRATLGTLPVAGELTNVLGELGTMAAVSGYSRGLETEADQVGLQWMIAAGYDPREAPKLFAQLLQDAEEEGGQDSFFFSTHPRLEERIRNYEKLLADHPAAGGEVRREIFVQKTARAFLATAERDLKAGRFAKAERDLVRYQAIAPRDARSAYLLGELHRQRGGEQEAEKAREQYRTALRLDPNLAESYRALGLLEFRAGRKAQARSNLEGYLKRAPRAEDREFIEHYIRQCR